MRIEPRILTAIAGLGVGLVVSAAPALARSKPILFGTCANSNDAGPSQPVGLSQGNAGTRLSRLRFNLLDPEAGNNAWVGASPNEALVLDVRVTGATEVDALINSAWGQANIPNVIVKFAGTNKARQTVQLVGNVSVRDWNNYVYTNTISGATNQEWWTNNLNPSPQDQTKRFDAHRFVLNSSFEGETLTRITIQAPSNAGQNFLGPMVFAVNVVYSGVARPKSCTVVTP